MFTSRSWLLASFRHWELLSLQIHPSQEIPHSHGRNPKFSQVFVVKSHNFPKVLGLKNHEIPSIFHPLSIHLPQVLMLDIPHLLHIFGHWLTSSTAPRSMKVPQPPRRCTCSPRSWPRSKGMIIFPWPFFFQGVFPWLKFGTSQVLMHFR